MIESSSFAGILLPAAESVTEDADSIVKVVRGDARLRDHVG